MALGLALALVIILEGSVLSSTLTQQNRFGRGSLTVFTRKEAWIPTLYFRPDPGRMELFLSSENWKKMRSGIQFRGLTTEDSGWSIHPFLLTEFHPARKNFWYGGMSGNYLSYQVGSWLTRMNYELLGNPGVYQFRLRGTFSLGNIGLSGYTQWGGGKLTSWWKNSGQETLWGLFTHREFQLAPQKPETNYGALTLNRKLAELSFPLQISLSGAYCFDGLEPGLLLATQVQRGGSYARLYFRGFSPVAAAARAEEGDLKISIFVKPGSTYNLLFDFDSETSLRCELVNRAGRPSVLRMELGVKW